MGQMPYHVVVAFEAGRCVEEAGVVVPLTLLGAVVAVVLPAVELHEPDALFVPYPETVV